MTASPPIQARPHWVAALPLDPAQILSAVRAAVGIGSWLSPSLTSRLFGLGSLKDDPRAAVVTRLFGVRELALALTVQHPNPDVRRTALQAGVAVDSLDVIATLIAVRRGAPKVILLTFGAGAALFAGLGVAALTGEQRP